MSVADFKSAGAARAIIHHQPTVSWEADSSSWCCVPFCVCVVWQRSGGHVTHICSPSRYGWAGIRVDTRRRCRLSAFPCRCAHSRGSCPCRWVRPWRSPLALRRKRTEAPLKLAQSARHVFSQETHGMSQMDESKSVKMPDVRFWPPVASMYPAGEWHARYPPLQKSRPPVRTRLLGSGL